TRPRNEKRVFQELSEMSIEAFLPTYRVRRRWSDRYRLVDEPLFKNYLFVNASFDRYHEILRRSGALSFITFGGKPAQIPQDEIASIRRLVDSDLSYDPH